MPHPLKQRFVLDTSLFLTDGIRRDGESLADALARFLGLVSEAKLELDISCYIPPSVFDELTTMLADRDVSEETLSKLNTWLIKKNPDRYGVMIPAEIVYEYVEVMADRVNQGLRVSEKAVRKAEDSREGNDENGISDVDRVISELRDEYRSTLRRGVLDSREDFDLLILARELDAGVVTEDTGVIDWAESFGLRYIRGRDFPTLLDEYLSASVERRYPE
jgi:hypothetical protein